MKRHFILVYSCIVAASLIFSLGCAKKLDDAKMSSEIQAKFSQDSGLSSKQLAVQANNGVVTLSGTVDNQAQRDAAGMQAASVAGVRTVINNLQVGQSAAAASETQKPTPAEASSVAPNTPPAQNVQPARAKKASRRHRADDAAGTQQDASQRQVASNDQPANGNMAPLPADNPPAAAPAPPPPPPAPKKLIIDQGTQITIRLVDAIDSEKNQTGDTFHATLNAPLTSDGEEAVPAGVELIGHLVDVQSGSKFAGKSVVVMQLDSLTSGGQKYSLQTDQYRKETAGRGKNTAEKVGGGAVVGSIIGALAGGGKGAAIGAAAGAGVGGGVQAASKSPQIKLASETVLSFTLQAPITVVQASSSDANRPKLGTAQ
ncbi:MAG TPA: BON domain-containing protein [Candidatus Binatia bacterium]|nr:BON domain-containing protein [Candidatus Binatia bacterium]